MSFSVVSTLSLSATADASEVDMSVPATNALNNGNETSRYVDPSLIGTKIKTSNSSQINGIITPFVGGYTYKNISWSETVKSRTYLGQVAKGKSANITVKLPLGILTIGHAYSINRLYKEYRVNSTFRSIWAVYDQYSGNYMYNQTFTNDVTYLDYVRVQ